MSVVFIGDEHLAQEVLFKIKQWDDAIAKLDIYAISDLCERNMQVFDVSSQIEGVSEFKNLWQEYKPYFANNVRVYRKEIKIFVESDLAFMHCYAKVDHAESDKLLNLPWCRTTLCFQKNHGKWKIAHQHISVPQNLEKSY
ncbi:hypothetical protein B9T31_04340 [Acinetobacter sp. ANC 4558]|uniref:YybH family protein n=1 Tax=Acinetobacter sp. ANC 4558 TaxID=1977876 RepID=UPI000A35B4CA|nr:nuclear transport factor 2 family protein [Acinetobacter sp. ANC 4558]OTG87726.1 hypothetical protein B9T31_04340 [Acinetobacter sp. ANC 4558]